MKANCISFIYTMLFCVLSSVCLNAQPGGFINTVETSSWNQVVGFDWDQNGQQYVWEKRGMVWIVDTDGNKLPNPLLDIREEVGNWRDFGLLGFALHPNFLNNGYFYVHYLVDRHHLLNFGTPNYSPSQNEYFDASIGRLTRYQADINTNFTTLVPNSRKILIGETKETGTPHLHESHGIGQIAFGTDETLLVAMGDGASYSSLDEGSASETYWQQALDDGIIQSSENIGAYRCQINNSLNGKILRVDAETGDGVPSNPFYDANNPRSAASRVWSKGVRNPYRMTKKPDTGDHDPAAGDPGVFYFGDVGWGTWEDLNVIVTGGQNFGWPKYEGIDGQPGYNNPVYAPGIHTRPKIDFRHGQDVARGWVNGMKVNVGSANLPGNPFRGNASTGGVWYTGDDFPPEYKDTYFHADYSQGWIKNFVFDNNHNPQEVRDFADQLGPVVFLNTHPIDGGLWFVSYPNEIRKISFTGSFNRPPIAQASAQTLTGNAPLNIQFTGDQSFDPDFDPINYLWDFGDGTTSTEANPIHTFTANNSNPQAYTVTLTVDDGTLSDSKSINISVNNTPPIILSTSVDNLTTFSPINYTTLNLSATVADAESPNSQLDFAWDIELHHNEHFHAEPTINAPSSVTTLSPIGCNGATYWYRIILTVTDPSGAQSTTQKDLYPDCTGQSQTITFPPITDKVLTDSDFTLNATTTSGLPITYYVTGGPAIVTNNSVSLTGLPGEVTIIATQPGNNTIAAALPIARTFMVNVPAAGNCNPVGNISWDQWANVSGDIITDIPLNEIPDFSGILNIFEIPVNSMDNFGTRLRGYICPPVTGQYTFWIASDNNGVLYLSTNSDPNNKTIIASVLSWTGSRQWNKFPSQESAPVTLIAGQEYYIEALQKEGEGEDNLAVGWQLPNGNLQRPIPGNRLSPYNGMPPTAQFTANPLVGNAPVNVNFNATASSDGDGTITNYDWDFGNGETASGAIIDHLYDVAGMYTVTLTVTDNDGNTATNSTIVEVTTAGMQDQTINFPAIGNKLTTDAPFYLNATATSGLPVGYQVVSGPASLLGNQINLNGTVGTVIVRATQSGNALFNPASPVDRVFQVVNGSGNGDIDLELSMSTSENEPGIYTVFSITTTLENTGSADATGVKVEVPLPNGVVFTGGDEFTASQGSYTSFSSQVWTVGNLPAGSSATLQCNFFVLTSDPITAYAQVNDANENDVDSTPDNGTCCTSSEDDEVALTVPQTGLADQTITFPNITNREADDPPFGLSATASSGLPVQYVVISGPASISGNIVTLSGSVGTVTIEATQSGNADFNPAPPVQRTFSVIQPGLLSQSIAFSNISDKETDDADFDIFATASSGLPVSFSIVSGPATISGNTISLTGATGNVTVKASQNGNAQYNPAPEEFKTFAVTLPPGQADIDLSLNLTASNLAPGQWTNFTVTATITNDGPLAATNVEVDFQRPDGTVFQGGNEIDLSQGSYNFNGNMIWDVGTLPAGESATLDLNLFLLSADVITYYAQVEDADDVDADSTPGNGACCVANEDDEAVLNLPQTAGPQPQVINFPSLSDKFTTDNPFTIAAFASSGLPVSLSIDNGPATISGNTVTLTGNTGTVVIRATQSGNADWDPAMDVTRSFLVNEPGAMNQTISFSSISNKMIDDGPFSVSATATSGLSVSFSIVSGPASISGNTITLGGTVGQVVVEATQNGNADWNPAPPVQRSFLVSGPPGSDQIDLSLSMTATNPELIIWNNNIFTLTIENNGAVTANNIVVDFPIPMDMAFTGVEHSQGSYDLFFQEWSVGTLEVGESATLELELFILQNIDPTNVFAQVQEADEVDSDSTPDNNSTGVPSEDDEALVTVLPPVGSIQAPIDIDITAVPASGALVSIYPNPVRHQLNCRLGHATGKVVVKIFDLSGRIIAERNRYSNEDNLMVFDVQNWSSGNYIVWVQEEGKAPLVCKVVVE